MFCFCKITNPTHLPAIIISKPCLFQVHLLSERTISIRSKISKMVVVIVALFTICWGPIQIFVLFQSFYPNFKANYTTYKIKTWANCMSYANSSINPIVYGFMGASFRKSFRKTFPFLFRHKVRDSSVASRTANAEIKFVATEESNTERKWEQMIPQPWIHANCLVAEAQSFP